MICSTAVNKNASEFVDGNAAANGASAPVVFCRNRMNVSTQFWRQRCPDHNSVKMARMVGKVDALAEDRIIFGGATARPPASVGRRRQEVA